MSISTLILGESGTGKSASLRNFEPGKLALIQAIKKPLPFRNTGLTVYVSDDWNSIIRAMQKAAEKGVKIIVIDDFQYVMANEFMRRSTEVGFTKFTEIGSHAWEIFVAAAALPDDVRVYILSHVEETNSGTIKMKTIGKCWMRKSRSRACSPLFCVPVSRTVSIFSGRRTTEATR